MLYFDNAATSRFKPRSVRKAAISALMRSANPGRGSHSEAMRAAMVVHSARHVIAEYAHAKNANVIFTKNCTEALNLAILGTAKLGGHVITTAFEHNSVLRPLHMLKKEGLISLSVVSPKDGKIRPEDILSEINEKSYLVAVTAMSNVTGYAPPLAEIGEICAAHGLLFLVDGAQGLGHTPIDFDAMHIDLLCGAGHKSLHGAQGTGFLIYGKNTFINPIMYGGTGTESDKLTQPLLPPESLESGTLNYTGISALRKGVLWTEKHAEKLLKKTQKLSEYLHEEIAKLSGLQLISVSGSPIVTFYSTIGQTERIADELNEKYDIAVRYGLHCAPLIYQALALSDGTVRISIGANNSLWQAKRLVTALREILARV